ncbi:L-2-amino-thiazoline-4-carboxylic acid hydrolase [Acuticoccus sp. M5D2P5]|uniref:L-2-amino-thiazoline-4-carboxylic acid hydrolase n=1 Tax=Acuticoccus kalidii TaxID=2910977 RepID=UPI001F409CC9|nr:L-2-amino-thiazoline-4-carboxylic acid hydrolase [Acuticoccus kalidii]MCF3936709.1 L-2-amino-thiazoline-4-carboxylic acid hydrolase [Acuticoccus kalidii]
MSETTRTEEDAAAEAIAALPMLARRRIEAEIIRPVYEELVERLGRAEADQLLTRVIRKSAIAQGEAMAEAQGGDKGIEGFAALLPRWTAGGALEIDEKVSTPDHLEFDVVRCRYAEMYREMGLGHIGHILSCNRDGTFCEGYDERIEFHRSQTIMGGASHCDFRYQMRKG